MNDVKSPKLFLLSNDLLTAKGRKAKVWVKRKKRLKREAARLRRRLAKVELP